MKCDASVLIIFARAGRLSLLRSVVRRLDIPPEVQAEAVLASPLRPDAQLIEAAIKEGWVRVVRPEARRRERLRSKYPNLGPGELACLALAPRGSTILLDDGAARRAAKLEGLVPVGSLGVLALAHRRRLLRRREDVAGALRDLLEGGLWVGADVIEEFWARLGGRP